MSDLPTPMLSWGFCWSGPARIVLGDQGRSISRCPPAPSRSDVADGRTPHAVRSPAKTQGRRSGAGRTAATSSRLLYEAIGKTYDGLGFDAVADGCSETW